MKNMHTENQLKQTGHILNTLGCLCAVTVISTGYVLLIKPMQTQANYFSSRGDDLVQFLNTSSELHRENERLKTHVQDQRNRWNNLLARIPANADESKFLAQITELSQANSLKIRNFSPGNSHDIDACSQKEIQLTFAGTYRDLCRFLNGLGSESRITNIKNITITTPNQNHFDSNYTVIIDFQVAYGFKDAKVAANL